MLYNNFINDLCSNHSRYRLLSVFFLKKGTGGLDNKLGNMYLVAIYVCVYIHTCTHTRARTHRVTRELTTEPHVLALKPMMLFGCCPQPPCVIFLKAMLPVFSTPFLYLPWKISFLTVFSALIFGSYFEERLIIYKCKAGYLCHLVASHLTQNKNQCPSSDRRCYMESDLCHLSDPVSCSSI